MYLIGPTCQVVCLVASTSLQVSLALSYPPEDRTLLVTTLCLALVPHIVVNLVSLLWTYATVDWGKRRTGEAVCVLSHLLHGGIVWRYIKLLLLKDRKDLKEFAILRLLQASIQEAPFAVLCGSVMVSRGEGSALGVVAVAMSFLSLSVAYTCPVRTKPLDNPVHQSLATTSNRYLAHRTVQFLSHLSLLGSRLLAAICFVSAFGYWIFLTVGLHFSAVGCIVLSRFIRLKSTGQKGSNYSVLLLQIYDTIDFFDLSTGVAIFFHLLVAVENLTMTFLWLSDLGTSLRNIAISVTVFCTLAMGFTMTLIREKCLPLRTNSPEENKKPEDKRRILEDKSPNNIRAIPADQVNNVTDCQDDFSLSVDIINASTPNGNTTGSNGMSLSSPTSLISMSSARRGLSLGDTPSALQDSGYLSRVETPPLTETDIESITCIVDMGPLLGLSQVETGVAKTPGVDTRCRHQKEGAREEMCLECQVDIFFISGKTCSDHKVDIHSCLEIVGDSKNIDTTRIQPLATLEAKGLPNQCKQPWLLQTDSETVTPQEVPDTTTHEPVHTLPSPRPQPNRAWADFTSTSSDSSRECRRRVRRIRPLPQKKSKAVVRGSGADDSESLSDSCSLTFCDICGHSSLPSDTSTSDSDWDESSQDDQALTWPPSRRVLLSNLPQDIVDPNDHVSAWLQNVSHGDAEDILRRDSMQKAMASEVSLSIRGLFPRTLESKTTGKGRCARKNFKCKTTNRVKRRSAKHILLSFCSFSGRQVQLPSGKKRQTIKSACETVDFVPPDTCDMGKESSV